MTDLRLLIVDDEPGMREGMRRSLRNFCLYVEEVEDTFQLQCDVAASGEEALEKITVQAPDLMLLDNKLPGIQGMDLLQHLTETQPEITVIMVTAYASIEAAVSATKRGAFDFLAKPFTPKELQATLEKAIRHLVLQRHAKKLTKEKRRARFDLLSVVSHELKAPLSALESHLYVLKEPESLSTEAYTQSIERCFKRISDMRKLINDFLDLTRIESGQRTRRIETVDVCEILQESLENISDSVSHRGIHLAFVIPESMQFQADRSELEIIFNNLLTNAVKYNRDGGKVTVDVTEEKNGFILRVSDTGIGMSKEDVSRLFKEFTRIRNAKTRDIPGSGLGLAIVRKIASLYGGTVSVSSTLNVGTTFTVHLPKASESNVAKDDATS